ncbi:AraC family transcriptional regulator [Paraferrimonas sp. SM1919]|uniref:AraC family transcriptional regulator n=1 Tax=Paraferrimonas sp. SM1919 TaxID=2662263 RepID=UPI0013D30152|nr:AraC family transcriptional regulator [Paraferrimonas sp. SM1919]
MSYRSQLVLAIAELIDINLLQHSLDRATYQQLKPLAGDGFEEIEFKLHRAAKYIPDIVYDVMHTLPIEKFGLYSYCLISSVNLKNALNVATELLQDATTLFDEYIEHQGDWVYLKMRPKVSVAVKLSRLEDNFLVGNLRWIAELLPSSWPLQKITVSLTAEQRSLTSKLQKAYQFQIIEDSDECFIRFPAKWLEWPIPSKNIDSSLYLSQPEKLNNSVTEQVKSIVLDSKFTVITLEQIAPYFYCSARTLKQKLAQEGQSMRQLLVQIRVELAKHLLLETHMNIDVITEVLKYSQASAFIRNFKSCKGITPKQYRKQKDQH